MSEYYRQGSRNFYKRNYVEAMEKITPEIYISEDLALSGTENNPVQQLISSHTRAATNIASILSISSIPDTATEDCDNISGISKFFVKQNTYTQITPEEFDRVIMQPLGSSIASFDTSSDFQTFLSATLLPMIRCATTTDDSALTSNISTLSALTSDSAPGTVHAYLAEALGWFYFLNRTGGSYDPHTGVASTLARLFTGDILNPVDGIVLFETFLWRSRLNTYIPTNYQFQTGVDNLGTYTSGTQKLDALLTLTDAVYSDHFMDRADSEVQEAFDVVIAGGYLTEDLTSKGPLRKFQTVMGYAVADYTDGVEGIGRLMDISKATRAELLELAKLLGWKLRGTDTDKWRLQLESVVDIYKQSGTFASIQAAINNLVTNNILDLSGKVSELYESYVPFLIWYALASDSPLFKSLKTWTPDKAHMAGLDSYSTTSLEENLQIATDYILFKLWEEYPKNFIFNNERWDPPRLYSLDAFGCVTDLYTVYNQDRMKDFQVYPFESPVYFYKRKEARDKGRLHEFEAALSYGPLGYGVYVEGDSLPAYGEDVFLSATGDLDFVFSYRGHFNYPVPPFEEVKYFRDCTVDADLAAAIAEQLVCFGVSREFAEQVESYLTSLASTDTTPLLALNEFLILTKERQVAPNYGDIILNGTTYQKNILDLWNGKSSHLFIEFEDTDFDFTKQTLEVDSVYALQETSRVANDFAPAHTTVRVNLTASAEDEAYDYSATTWDYTAVEKQEDTQGYPASGIISNFEMSGSEMTFTSGGGDFGILGSNDGVSGNTTIRRDRGTDAYDTLYQDPAQYISGGVNRRALRRRHTRGTLPKGGYYDRTGFNGPVAFDASVVEMSTGDSLGELTLGYVPSSGKFHPVGDAVNVSGVWDKCENLDSPRNFSGVDTSNTFPYRGLNSVALNNNEKIPELSPSTTHYVDRGQLPEVYWAMHKMVEEQASAFAFDVYENNTGDYAQDEYWKNVTLSLANSAIDAGYISRMYSLYTDYEFGNGLHKLFDDYSHNYTHELGPTYFEKTGANIFAHVFGKALYNIDFEIDGSAVGSYVASSFAVGNEINQGAGSGVFSEGAAGTYIAETTADMVPGRKEFRNPHILSGIEFVCTSGSSERNEFSIYRPDPSLKNSLADSYFLDNTLVEMRSVDGLPRMRFDLSAYGEDRNLLVKDHKFKLNLKGLIGNDYSNNLGGGKVGVWIHTNEVSGYMWSWTQKNKWELHKVEDLSPNAVLEDLAIVKNYAQKEIDTNCLIHNLPEYADRAINLLDLREEWLEDFEINFDTRNYTIHNNYEHLDIIPVPNEYYKIKEQVHRNEDTNYVVEIFMVPDSKSDNYFILDEITLQDTTQKERSGKPLGFGTKTNNTPLRRFVEEKVSYLSKPELLSVLKFFKGMSGQAAGIYSTLLGSRDATQTSGTQEQEGGSRLNYKIIPELGVHAKDTGGNGIFTNVAFANGGANPPDEDDEEPPNPPPGQVQNLNVRDEGDQFVALQWDALPDTDIETYYVVFDTDSDFTSGATQRNAGNVTEFTVTGLTNDTLYYFVVYAEDTTDPVGQTGPTSNIVTGIPTAGIINNAPDQPSILNSASFEEDGMWFDTSTVFTYGEPQDPESDMSSMVIFSSLNSAGPYSEFDEVLASGPGVERSYFASGLTNDVVYYFKMKAKDDSGQLSIFSNGTAVGKPTDQTPPPTPSFLSVPGIGTGTTIALEWPGGFALPEPADFSHYDLRFSLVSLDATGYDSIQESDRREVPSPGLGNALAVYNYDANLKGSYGNEVFFRVRSVDLSGNVSDWSEEAVGTPQDFVAPTLNGNLSATFGDGEVSLDWGQPASHDEDLKGYFVYRSTVSPVDILNSALRLQSGADDITGTQYNDTTVENGTEYYYVYTAMDQYGNESAASNEVTGTPAADPGDITPPTAPSFPAGEALDQSVSLGWGLSTDADSGVSGYVVLSGTNTIQELADPAVVTAGNSVFIGDLTNGTSYYFWVKAVDNAGNESPALAFVNTDSGSNAFVPEAEGGGDPPNEFANYTVEFQINQRYQNTDPELAVQIGEPTNLVQTFSLQVSSDNTNTVVDNNHGMSATPWRYKYCELQDSWVSATPRWAKNSSRGWTFGDVEYDTIYDSTSIAQTRGGNTTLYEGFVSNHKALDMKACVVEHAELVGGYEINVVISNSFQHNGAVYAQTENNFEGNFDGHDWSMRVVIKDKNGAVVDWEEIPWATYFRPRQPWAMKFYINDPGNFLRDYKHFDPQNNDLVPDPVDYVSEVCSVLGWWDDYALDRNHRQYGFHRNGIPGQDDFDDSYGEGGITPYFEWRKGHLGYMWWHREMIGRFSHGAQVMTRRSDGDILSFDEDGYKCHQVLDHPNTGGDGRKYNVGVFYNGTEYVKGDDAHYGSVESNTVSWFPAGYNEVALMYGSDLWTANPGSAPPVDYPYSNGKAKTQVASTASGFNAVGNDQYSKYRYLGGDPGQSFLDDNIFNSHWMFQQVVDLSKKGITPGDSKAARPIRENNARVHTQAGFSHKTRDYRAAAVLARKCMLARWILKTEFNAINCTWRQTGNGNIGRLGLDKRTRNVLFEEPTGYVAPGDPVPVFGYPGQGATWAVRDWHQPARAMSKILAINESISNPAAHVVNQDHLESSIALWLSSFDAIAHPQKGWHRDQSAKPSDYFYYTDPYFSDPARHGGPKDVKGYERGHIRTFQQEIGMSLLADVARNAPGNFGNIARNIQSNVFTEQNVKQRMLTVLQGWKDTHGRVDRPAPNFIRWGYRPGVPDAVDDPTDGYYHYLSAIDVMYEAGTDPARGPILAEGGYSNRWFTYMSPLVPSGSVSYPNHPQMWATPEILGSQYDRDGAPKKPRTIHWNGDVSAFADVSAVSNMNPAAYLEAITTPTKALDDYIDDPRIPEAPGDGQPGYYVLDSPYNLNGQGLFVQFFRFAPVGGSADVLNNFYSHPAYTVDLAHEYGENYADTNIDYYFWLNIEQGDRFYKSLYNDAIVRHQMVRSVNGGVESDKAVSGFGDNVNGWDEGGTDLWDTLTDGLFGQPSNAIYQDTGGKLDVVYPSNYQSKLAPISDGLP